MQNQAFSVIQVNSLQDMEPAQQKPAMFVHELNLFYFPSLIATLNNYACSLPPLANVNCSAFC